MFLFKTSVLLKEHLFLLWLWNTLACPVFRWWWSTPGEPPSWECWAMPAGMCSLAGTRHRWLNQTGVNRGTTLPIIALSWFVTTPETGEVVWKFHLRGERDKQRRRRKHVLLVCHWNRLRIFCFHMPCCRYTELLGGAQRVAFWLRSS